VSTWIADKNGTNIFENEASRRLFGIDSDVEVVGKYNIFKDEQLIAQGVMPQIRKVFDEGGSTEIIADYDSSRIQQFEVGHPTHKLLRGFLFAITDESGAVRYVVIQHEDYTARYQAEKSLAESESRYRQLVEDVSDWVWAVDIEGRYTYSSPVVESILGYKVEEIIGKSAFEFIVPEDQGICRNAFTEAVLEKKPIVGLMNRNLRKDGSISYLETSGKPIFDEQGNVIGFRGVDRDITERKKAEQIRLELEEHKRDFYRRTILAATEGKLEITERDEIFKITGPAIASWTIKEAQDIGEIRRAIADIAKSVGMDQSRIDDFILAFGEAATNAYKHAGGGVVSLHEIDGALTFIISDTGKGISALSLPEVAMKKGYSTVGSLGMGYKTILSLADKVYLATGEGGTTVAVCMGLRPAAAPQSLIDLMAAWAI
jgi:PAS domain S-box-containing protein